MSRGRRSLLGISSTLQPSTEEGLDGDEPEQDPGPRSQRDEPVGRAQHLDPERMYISTEVHQGVTVTSAGSRPKPDLHPNTVRVLRETFGIDVSGSARSTWTPWPGTPSTTRSPSATRLAKSARSSSTTRGESTGAFPDPAAAEGTDDDSDPAFERAAADIDTRIRHLLPLLTAAADERTSRDRT